MRTSESLQKVFRGQKESEEILEGRRDLMSVIICDTREQKANHITDYFDANGIKWIRSKMFVGDYSLLDNMTVCIDRKKDLQEVYSNVVQQHKRFHDEAVRARDNGIRLVVLIEDNKIQTLDEVHAWNNPRIWQYKAQIKRGETPKYRPPVSSELLQKIMERFTYAYGIEWRFCRKQDTAKTMLEILEYGG